MQQPITTTPADLIRLFRDGKLWWESNPGPQTSLFSCPVDIICYGGSRGGAKSESAIPWAAGFHCFPNVPQYFDVARYRSVVFRRTLPELKRHIIERSHHFLQGWWKYTERDHIWERKTPDGGKAVIEFAYLESPSDIFRYTGVEYARIIFDESNLMSEREVRFMLTCLRTSAQGVKPQMLLLPNPMGPGYAWHKEMFVKNRKRGTLLTYPPYYYDPDYSEPPFWPSDGQSVGLSTCFIPARLRDNPKLLKNDPNYINRLRSQYGKLADALIEGSWDEGEHIAFDQFTEWTHCIPAFDDKGQFAIPPWADTWLSVDWGGTGKKAKDFAACVLLAADHRRVYGAWDHSRQGRDIVPFAHEIVEKVRMSDKLQKPRFCVLSHECFADHGMGNTQAELFAKVLDKEGIVVVKGGRNPQGRLILMREFLRLTPLVEARIGHDAQDAEYWTERLREGGEEAANEYMRLVGLKKNEEVLPRLQLLLPTEDGRYGCPGLMRNLPILATDIKNPLVLAENQNDDEYDAAGQGLQFHVNGPPRPIEDIYQEMTGGRVPQNTLEIEKNFERAGEAWEKQDGVALKPIPWPMKRFE